MKKILLLFGLLLLGWQSNAQNYCVSGGPTLAFDTNVQSVDLIGENTNIAYLGCQAGGLGEIGVEDQTAQVADLVVGNTYNIDIQFGSCGGSFPWAGELWIDYNRNFVFDPGESIGVDTGNGAGALSSYTFTVPAGSINGSTRLRVMQWEGGANPLDPCATFSYGSVTDFGISISGGVDILCDFPFNPSLVQTFDTSAEFSWDVAPDASNGYVWEVYAQNADPAVDASLANGSFPVGTTGTVTGLTDLTDYDFYLASDCGADGISDFNGPVPFSTIATCPDPTNITLTSVADVTADVTWVESFAAVNGYIWEVYAQGDTPGTDPTVANGTFPTGTSSGQVTGLTAETAYDLYMISDCGADGQSVLNGPIPFTTACTVFVAPYFNDFENFTVTTTFTGEDCWSENSTGFFGWDVSGAGTGSFGTGPNSAFSGSNFLFTEASSGVAGDEALLVSPLIDLSALTNPALSFYFHMFGGDIDTLNIDIDPGTGSGYDLNVLTITGQQQANQGDAWIQQFVDLAAYAGQTVTVRFRVVRGPSFAGDVSIDDVNVDEAPSCFAPVNVAVSNLGSDSADVSWDEVSNATNGYDWELYLAGEDPATTTATQSGNAPFGTTTVSFTGLGLLTSYDFYVTADCDTGGVSSTVGPVNFTTIPPNDNACGAIPLTVGIIPPGDTYSNFAATAEPNEPVASCFNGGIDGSVWFTFIAPASGEVEVSTDIAGGTLTDTELAVYDAPTDCADLTTFAAELGCGQDEGVVVGFNSIVNLTGLTAGNTYYIQVDTWGGAPQGTFGISVIDTNPPCPAPENVVVTNTASTTADFSWDDVVPATDGYNWYVFAPGADVTVDAPLFSGNVGVGVLTASVTGLTANTSYDFYVESNCGVAIGTSTLSDVLPFTTDCDVFVAPYSQDFESFPVTTSLGVEDCFQEISTGFYTWDVSTGGTPSFNTGPIQANSGANYIFTESSSGAQGDFAEIETATVDLSPLASPVLRFYSHMFGADMGILHVDVDDGNGYVLDVFTITGPQQTADSDPWTENIVDLSAFAGSTVTVKFRGERGASFTSDMAIDDVSFVEAPSCFTPTGLTVTNTSNDSVDVTWDDNPSATDGYVILVFNDGDDPLVDAPVVTSNEPAGATSATVSGLLANSTYQVYIQADCGATDGLSLLSSGQTFTTLCDIFVAPYFNDFESLTPSNAFVEEDCWTEASPGFYNWDVSGGGTPSFDTGPAAAFSGSNFLFTEASSGAQGDEAFLVSPLIDVSSLSVPALFFYYHMFGADMGTLHVDVDDGSGAGYVNVFSLSGPQQLAQGDPWIEQIIDLSAYAGQTIQLRFRGERGSSFESDMAIDDVRVDEAPPCLKPVNLTIVNVFFDSIELSWGAVGNAVNGYIWEVYNAGDDPTTATPVSTGTFAAGTTQGIADGLTPETAYDIYIISDCGATDGQSDLAGPVNFTTAELCALPTTFDVVNILPDSAELSWTAIPNATNGYNWAIFNAGDDPLTATPVSSGTAASGDTSVIATGLTDNTNYEAYITTDCGTDGLSDLSSPVPFLTPCVIFTAPYFNDFETFPVTTSLTIADCWTEASPGTYTWDVSNTGTGSFGTGPNQAFSGTNFVFTEASSGLTGDEAILISPLVDLSTLSSPALSFWYHMHGINMGTINVDVNAGSGFDLAVFSLSGQQQPNQADAWIQQYIDLSAYAGQVVTVRLRAERGAGFESDISIDDFRIDEAPTCLSPTGLTFSNEGTNSVDISWSPVGNATTGYNWLVFLAGADPDVDAPFLTGSVGPGITSTTINGLNPATAYDVYVQSNCGAVDGLSELSNSVSFQTLCAPLLAPYFNDFEAFAAGDLVEQECWIDVTTSTFDWEVSNGGTGSTGTGPNQAFSGTNFLFTEASSGAQGDEGLLESPELDLSGLGVPALSFWYHMHGADMGTLHVDVDAGNGYDLSVFSLVGEQQPNQDDDWIQQFVDLSVYAGQIVTIRFRGERGNGFTGDMSIDDVRVDEAPTCFDPNGLVTISVTDVSAQLDWAAGSSETVFDVEVVPAGSAPTGVPTFEDVTLPFTATGLTPETDYDFYVRADCGAGDVSNWVGPSSFTTTFSPIIVTVDAPPVNNTYCYDNNEFKEWLFTSSDGTTPVEITFNAGTIEDGTGSTDRCRIFDGFDTTAPVLYDSDVDGTDMAGVTVIANSGTAYMLLESDIFGSCQGGVDDEDPLDFDVFAGTISTVDFSADNFKFHPNPVETVLNIQSASVVENIELFDISGKRVVNNQYNSNNIALDLETLSSGVYMMKVTIGNNTQVFKVVKR